MKIGIIGLPQAGKTTIFEALTGAIGDGQKAESRLGTMHVPDDRVDVLSRMFNPKKTTYAQVEYFLPAAIGDQQAAFNQIRDCDALIHVIRNFSGPGFDAPRPIKDFHRLDAELTFADLVVAEKRYERLTQETRKGKKAAPEEIELIEKCLAMLNEETPLRRDADLAADPLLRGFTFLSAKPRLVLFNNADEDESPPEGADRLTEGGVMVMRGKLEQELVQMTDGEAAEFLKEFNIAASALDRVVQKSYDLLGLISFFTVGDDEVRAWTIRRGTVALDAAEVIHSDLKKGFIRAEVIPFNELAALGSYAEARKKGALRLEGKTYEVRDGDIMHVRFNV